MAQFPVSPDTIDVTIVGAGAAGLASAIFIKRANPRLQVRLLEGARRPGAKILVSGGARCNITNRTVSEQDFWGGRRSIIRRVLRGLTVSDTIRFFGELGVPLHEEEDGKLFPDSGRSRDVLAALLHGVETTGTELLSNCRVLAIERAQSGFRLVSSLGTLESRFVVLATGGLSLPRSGSDGAGLEFARHLGHTIVLTTPALVPLVLDDTSSAAINRELAGVTHEAELAVWIDGRVTTRLCGSLLWTHVGISGPVALNASRHWLRAEVEGRPVRLTLSFCPGGTFETQHALWTAMAAAQSKVSLITALSGIVPTSVAAVLLDRLQIDPTRPLAQITRDERRRVVRAITEWRLPVTSCRGYTFAEATAGGVALDEVDLTTMESRVSRGLYLVGEILDVDGRIGGFNFQWAWSTAFLVGRAFALRR